MPASRNPPPPLPPAPAYARAPTLGGHAAAVLLLVTVSAFVGGMVGIERTILPLLAEDRFGIASKAAAVAFIATFGLSKAAVNFVAGRLSDHWGRRRILLLGWAVGLPVPLVLLYAPSWGWILAANVLLGVNQGLTWSMTVVMKVDLVPGRARALVVGWNEFAGYAGMAGAAALTGYIASVRGLWPEPFYVGLALAATGLALSWLTADTRPPESAHAGAAPAVSLAEAARDGSFAHPALSAASLAGLVTNLKDGALWGLLAMLLTAQGLPLDRAGVIVGLYPAVWAVTQLAAGPLAARLGSRTLILAGLALQALGVGGFAVAGTYAGYVPAAVLAGLGTGLVYPTLQVLVSDTAGPARQASALGVYRFWRDAGYAVGALGAGAIAELGLRPAMGAVAVTVATATLVVRARTGDPAPRRPEVTGASVSG